MCKCFIRAAVSARSLLLGFLLYSRIFLLFYEQNKPLID